MLKFIREDTQVVFSEIPDEITLVINISHCPCHCPSCHSKYLWEDIGEELTTDIIDELVAKNRGITCVCFMGGDINPREVERLAEHVKNTYGSTLKVGWYSGSSEKSEHIDEDIVDYIKIGPYIDEYGPLNKETTNQRMYFHGEDITYKFWKKI